MSITRRVFLKHTAAGLAALGGLGPDQRVAWAGGNEAAVPDLGILPGKKPLIRQTYRPPNYETPPAYFHDAFTPNDAFFVRYHHAAIPEIDLRQWTLRIAGDSATRPLEFTLAELKRDFPQVELAALCVCAGNRRGLFQPRVPGLQWGNGAMGNARWKGVRLRDVLNQSGIDNNAVEVAFDGADTGVTPRTPDFIKSLPMSKALDEDTLIAFEMNGEPLPHWNGFPARLIVPGWVATYWVKHLATIHLVSAPLQGFWMKTAYRIPRDRFAAPDDFATQRSDTATPVAALVVNSLITEPGEDAALPGSRPAEVRGVAWDEGSGIARVEVSTDQGRSWHEARLGPDYGRYSWRQWRFGFQPVGKGEQWIMARASNRRGETQPMELIPNPGGYHHNAVQKLRFVVV